VTSAREDVRGREADSENGKFAAVATLVRALLIRRIRKYRSSLAMTSVSSKLFHLGHEHDLCDCFLDQQEINGDVYQILHDYARYWLRKTCAVSTTPAEEVSCKRLTRWCLEGTIPTSSVSQRRDHTSLLFIVTCISIFCFGEKTKDIRSSDSWFGLKELMICFRVPMKTWIRDRRRESRVLDRLALVTTSTTSPLTSVLSLRLI
jgi:hypothetical protein